MVFHDELSSFSVLTVVLLFLLFILAVRYLKSNTNNGLPPGPRGWPIVGSTFNLDAESYLTFDKWAKIYGEIFTVQLGLENAIVLNSIDVIKSAVRDQADKFVDRPYLPIIELGFTSGGIVFENGYPWNERRRWAAVFLRNFCIGKKGEGTQISLERQLNIEAAYLCQEMDKQESPFFPFHIINNSVSNLICTASFGERFEYSDPKFKELMEGIRYLFNYSSFTSPVNAVPMLFHTPMFNQFREMVTLIKTFIGEEFKRHEETFDPNDIRDIIDAYIKETKEEGVDLELYSKDTVWRTIFDLFVAGTDTVSSTLLFIMLYFVNYPEVQKKVQQEVDEVLGQEKKPKWTDRHSMPYLEATIMEIQRLSNVAPFFVRKTTDDVNINGYKIPTNTTVFANIYSVQRDPKQWENPAEFNPERFLMDDLKTLKKHEAFIPFGLGRRVCIGELMARMEVLLFTANILQRFTFKIPEGYSIPSVDDCVPGLTRTAKPFKIRVIKR